MSSLTDKVKNTYFCFCKIREEVKSMEGCLAIILIAVVIVLFINYPLPAMVVTAAIIAVISFISANREADEEDKVRLKKESFERAHQKYSDFKSKITIPDNASKVNYKKGNATILNTKVFMWIEDNDLCFFPTKSPSSDTASDIKKIILYKIPISKIEYYATSGDVVYENKITGGGGGSSFEGALVGGAIAGGAGAIIGSRNKIDPISSELITHDSRETFLKYFDDNNLKHSMVFDFKDYEKFNELIPQKAFTIVNTIKTNDIIDSVLNESTGSNILDQIRELAKLKDEGILTEEEFSNKKKELLARIS